MLSGRTASISEKRVKSATLKVLRDAVSDYYGGKPRIMNLSAAYAVR